MFSFSCGWPEVLVEDHPVDAPVEAAVSFEKFGIVAVQDLGKCGGDPW
jgi:hypothetical protein